MYQKNEPSAIFHALHGAHRRRVGEESKSRGLADIGAPMLLIALRRSEEEGEHWSQRDLAQQLRCSPATVAVSLKGLEKNGYVSRMADDKDARRNRVTLTDKGRRAVDLGGESFRAVDRQMLAGFSEEEKTQLNGFLIRMLENLGGGEPSPFAPSKKECE